MRRSSKLAAVLANPALYPKALSKRERSPTFKWHDYAHSERSSQVFCISAFGTLRSLSARDRVLEWLFSGSFPLFPSRSRARRWEITLEFEEPTLLGETGGRQPTSVDVFCESSREVVCVESKFVTDAQHGFSGCSQVKERACAGFFGPGSDLLTETSAWCRLENWEKERGPRLYWSLGKSFFNPLVFRKQELGQTCPLSGSNYQLMRNFLFAAAFAEQHRKDFFGLMTIAPRARSGRLREQFAEFRDGLLLPEHRERVALVEYEHYFELLRATRSQGSQELADFLEERLRRVSG